MKAKVEYANATKRKKCHNPIALAHLPFPIAHQLRFISPSQSMIFPLSLSLSCPCPVPGDVAACTNAQRSWGKTSKKRIEKCLCQESIILAIFVESLHGHTYES